jgi:hypothetical protein
MTTPQPTGCLGFLFRLFGPDSASRRRAAPLDGPLPYRRRDYLFTKAERSFYGVLEQAVGDRYRIFAKVGVDDILWIDKGTGSHQTWRNKIDRKHIDFLLCDRDAIRPLIALELDDRSHERADRAERDHFLDQAFAAAGLPLLRVPAQHAYNVEAVRHHIAAALTPAPAPRDTPPSPHV